MANDGYLACDFCWQPATMLFLFDSRALKRIYSRFTCEEHYEPLKEKATRKNAIFETERLTEAGKFVRM